MCVKRLVDFLWGACSGVYLYCDCPSARQLGQKRVLGLFGILDLKLLFVQRMVQDKQLDIIPISGLKIPSDILTKAVDRQTLEKYFEILARQISQVTERYHGRRHEREELPHGV